MSWTILLKNWTWPSIESKKQCDQVRWWLDTDWLSKRAEKSKFYTNTKITPKFKGIFQLMTEFGDVWIKIVRVRADKVNLEKNDQLMDHDSQVS